MLLPHTQLKLPNLKKKENMDETSVSLMVATALLSPPVTLN